MKYVVVVLAVFFSPVRAAKPSKIIEIQYLHAESKLEWITYCFAYRNGIGRVSAIYAPGRPNIYSARGIKIDNCESDRCAWRRLYRLFCSHPKEQQKVLSVTDGK